MPYTSMAKQLLKREKGKNSSTKTFIIQSYIERPLSTKRVQFKDYYILTCIMAKGYFTGRIYVHLTSTAGLKTNCGKLSTNDAYSKTYLFLESIKS